MTHSILTNYTSPVGTLTTTVTNIGDENYEVDIAVASGTTNQAVAVNIAKATMVSLLLQFNSTNALSGTGGCTIKTNSTGAPQDVISLVNNQPLTYWANGSNANPFAGNVTQFYVTDTSGGLTGGTLHIRALNNQ